MKQIPTERECTIIQYLSQGLTHHDIGEQVFLAKKTVDGIVTKMLKKFSVKNATELVALAIRNQWI